ncbi:Glutamine synthetase [Geodia barretti]|uniref:Glutamine synthetase n=1 Tax=Geodia barretti TaxID=519541 RepID=A0AA35RRA8_GEOBA|nr:Glutamine synthetase [Geodia barretti]
MTPSEVIDFCKSNGIGIIDLRFTDLPGTLQHVSVPLSELTEANLAEGYGFDGSSIRGFKSIDESDMLLIPDTTTAATDPFFQIPTLHMICDVMDPITRDSYSRDPRHVAHKAEAYLKDSGIADTTNSAYYFIDSDEGFWNTGAESTIGGGNNLAYRPRNKEGYFPAPPFDTFQDIRSEMVQKIEHFGIIVEKHHHEVATAGQAEIDVRYDSLTKMADTIAILKYVVKNVAKAHGKVATFMPKPLFGDNGTGMHTHQSLWRDGNNLFYDANGYAMLSATCRHYIGGLLQHAPALLAFAAPTTNSYKRLVPGFEAPVNLVYSVRNRSACIRIPTYSASPSARRLEFRAPDPSCNPYLAFSAMLMAGIDGVINEIEPPDPVDQNLYEMSAAELSSIRQVPSSLGEALEALERDNEFLMRGGVFTDDLIETWLESKKVDVDDLRLRPHPYEFFKYFDA